MFPIKNIRNYVWSYIVKNIKSCKGQSMVETALVLPIILLILMGIFEFGRIMNGYIVVTNAAREVARVAAVGATDASIISTIRNAAQTLDTSRLSISISPSASARTRGQQVTVQVNYSISALTPIVTAILPNPFLLQGRTVMRVE